ncbi:MAG: hypothetical protein IKU70_00820 [Clostridia bacterium]|nr:hypothetical protein [Clostridia bacterium]
MKKHPWLRTLLPVLAAFWTALAFSVEIPIPLMADMNGRTLSEQLTRMLMVVFHAVEDNHLQTLLVMAAAWWSYRRFLFGQRRRMGETVLACLFALCMLWSMAVQATDSISVLWANSTQLLKAAVIWTGLVPLWLSVIRAIDAGFDWLKKQKPFAFRHPLLTPMLIMLAVWAPQAVIRYPGAVIFDTVHQLQEFFGDLPFTAMNPPGHTALIGWFVQLGDWLGCAHFGFFMVTLLQMIALSWILAWLLCVLQRLKMPGPLIWAMLACNALLPTYAAYATTVLKDSACTICVLLFMVQTALLVIRPEIFWEKKGRGLVLWAVSGALAILMRKNGIGMIAPTVAAAGIYALCRREWKPVRRWLPLVSGLLAIIIANGSLAWITAQYDVGGGSVRELLSIPFQQTARVLREHEVPQEEIDIINEVLDASVISEVYTSHISDDVKNTFREDATTQELLAYAKVWASHLIRYPSASLDALLGMTHTIFSPTGVHDDFYDVKVMQSFGGGKWRMDEWLYACPLSEYRMPLKWLYMLSLKLPVTGLMMNLGANVIATIVLAYLSFRRNRRLWIVWLPALLCLGMLLFSPITCIRYALPVYYAVPLLAAVLCHERMYPSK